jgi:hypothetical protein
MNSSHDRCHIRFAKSSLWVTGCGNRASSVMGVFGNISQNPSDFVAFRHAGSL